MKTASFRFYEELNDFLPQQKRKKSFTYRFSGSPSVKDAIEAIGIPHSEVDLILVNGESVTFNHKLSEKDHVSVYPVFESFDISTVNRLRVKPLRETRFILDVHLGKLAKYLRMAGFDTLYERYYSDSEIVDIATKEKRIILTRDVGVLKYKTVTHGYWIRSQDPIEQFREVIRRFNLFNHFRPFQRCMHCNGVIEKASKSQVIHHLKPRTRQYYNDFYRCARCNKVYWKGSHVKRMLELMNSIEKDK
jgi:uncharacterized protein with PIN domain